MPPKEFRFNSTVWLYPGEKGAWHFVSVPPEITAEIDFFYAEQKRGWGSLPVKVTIGNTSWETSIFTDKKNHSYLLPIKADVRKAEGIHAGEEIQIAIQLKNDFR